MYYLNKIVGALVSPLGGAVAGAIIVTACVRMGRDRLAKWFGLTTIIWLWLWMTSVMTFVVGVPLECISPGRSNGLAGMDSLLSIVQMPPKVPVATVGIGNAKNAAYLALEILGIKYPDIRKKLVEFRAKMVGEAEAEGGRGFEF